MAITGGSMSAAGVTGHRLPQVLPESWGDLVLTGLARCCLSHRLETEKQSSNVTGT